MTPPILHHRRRDHVTLRAVPTPFQAARSRTLARERQMARCRALHGIMHEAPRAALTIYAGVTSVVLTALAILYGAGLLSVHLT